MITTSQLGSNELSGTDNSITSVKDLVDRGGRNQVPSKYILPLSERPCFEEVLNSRVVNPVVISFQDLMGVSSSRGKSLQDIFQAAQEWGFFQVVDHGVPEILMERMWSGTERFLKQGIEERMKYYSNDLRNPVSYVTSFNPSKDKFLNWKYSLRLRFPPDTPLNTFANHLPSTIKDATIEYYQHVTRVGGVLQEALSESLGLDKSFIKKNLGAEKSITSISIHCYPPCPNPELTLGFSSHSDPNIFAMLQEKDNNIQGLHVLKDGVWVALHLLPNSFLLNLGDQLQILTNGEYKSPVHRVVTNSARERVSIATFFNPAEDAVIGPLPFFSQRPALYKETLYSEYLAHFYNQGLGGTKSGLDFATL